MTSTRDRLIERARARGGVTDEDVRRAEAVRQEYRRFGIETTVADVLASWAAIPPEEIEEARRGEDIPSRLAGLDVVRLAGGTAERPVFLARRAFDGETFLVHACMLSRQDDRAAVDEFVRAMEEGRRLTGPGWIPVSEVGGADGAYAAVGAVPEGARLDDRLAAKGPLAPAQAVAVLHRVAEALWPLQALGRAAVFPDPSQVVLGPLDRPSLVAMEVLLAPRPPSFDAGEFARSAANFLARLVGPERVADPAVRSLLADLGSGRLEALRAPAPPPISLEAPAPSARGQATPVGVASPSLPPPHPAPRPRPGPPARLPPVPAEARAGFWTAIPPWGWVAAAAAAAVIAFALLRAGGGPQAPQPTDPTARGPAEEPRPGPRESPPTPAEPTPTTRDPGLVALEEALAYLQGHRADDPRGVIDRLRALEARYGGTDAALRSSVAREQFTREVEAEADRQAAAIASDVERFLAAEEIGAAQTALERFPKSLAFTHATERLVALRFRVREKAEAFYALLRPALDAAADPAEQDAARAAFERVKSLGDPELTARAQQRLRDALDRAAGRQARRRDLEPDLDRTVGEALAAAAAGETERARRAVDAATRGPLGDTFPDRLGSAKDAVERIVRAYAAAAAEWRARAGKTATLALREYGSRPFAVTPGEVAGDRVTWTRGGIPGGARLTTVDPASLGALALSSGRETDPTAVLCVATLLAATGRGAEADAMLARAQSLGASAPFFAAEASASRAYLAAAAARETAAADALLERDRDGARAGYGRAAVVAPFLPLPHRRLAEWFAAGHEPEDALAEWQRAKSLGDAGPDVLHGLARAAAAAGRPETEVLEAWRAFLAAAPPHDPRLEAARAEAERLTTKVTRSATMERVRAAKALLDAGKAAEAVAALEEAAAEDPTSIEAQRALGRAAEKAEDVVKAYLAWQAAHDLAKSARDATEAKEQMDRLARQYGERPTEATVRKGAEAQAARGEYAGAVETFQRAVAMSPLDAEARLGLGGALLGLALRTNSKPLFEEGFAAYDVVTRVAPEDPRGWQGRGELRRWKGDYAGAVEDATASIGRRKDFYPAYNTRGLAHYQSLQFDAALADIGVVVTLAPLLATPRITRAGILAAMGRYDDAQTDLDAALERNPSEAERQQVQALREQVAARRKADRK